MAEERFYLFRPTDQDMKIEYPELAKEPAFDKLNTNELMFVWYYANRTSSYFTVKTGEIPKVKACIRKAYSGVGNRLKEPEYRKYLEGNFPEKIKDAIVVMNEYNPSARVRARIAIENIFNNLVESLELDDGMRKAMESDIDEKKKYIDLSMKVSDSLPKVIEQLEEGYGIRTSSFFSGEGGKMSVMDHLHSVDKQ